MNKLTMETPQEKSLDSDEKGNEFPKADKPEETSQKPTPEVDETPSEDQTTVSELFLLNKACVFACIFAPTVRVARP